jgi:predicted nucleotidyltransferase
VKLEEILRALYDESVEFVVIGGAAMQLQGSAHITEDLDFCYARTRKNFARLAKALQPFHPRLRNAPEDLPFRFDPATIERGMNFMLATDAGAIDFLGEVSGVGAYAEVQEASEAMNIFGMDHRVLSLEGLIKAKRAAARKKDLDVIEELEGLLDIRKRTGQ